MAVAGRLAGDKRIRIAAGLTPGVRLLRSPRRVAASECFPFSFSGGNLHTAEPLLDWRGFRLSCGPLRSRKTRLGHPRRSERILRVYLPSNVHAAEAVSPCAVLFTAGVSGSVTTNFTSYLLLMPAGAAASMTTPEV